MKKVSLLIVTILLFTACSGVKQTQEALNSGNYMAAINKSIAKLASNKTKKGNQEYIYLLEEAFRKNTEREQNTINLLKKEGNPANFERIYNTYTNLHKTQERVKALLPLRLIEENREANFSLTNYANDILTSKNKLSDYLYNNANNLINKAITKNDYRKAHEDLKYLDKLNPNYKNTRAKIEEAYQKGIDYVSVNLYNDSQVAIPQRLEDDLLNFNTYGLNNYWTRFHTNQDKNITYDYEMQIKFNSILVSPEKVNSREILKEKSVKDGWKYVLDANGNVKKDSLGNDIKVDKFITVKSKLQELTQFKESQVTGVVAYYDLKTKQAINSYPLSSNFVFKHIYATYTGDKRALTKDLLDLSEVKEIPFPSNEQMIYDTGEDLKKKIKSILKKYGFN